MNTISGLTMQNSLIDSLQASRYSLSQKQLQIVSGKKYAQRSDAPAETAKIAAIHQRQADIDMWQQNIVLANTWTKVSESRLSDTMNIAQRAHELTIESIDATKTPEDLANIAEEIDNLLESTLQIANSKFGNNHLFAGTNTGQAPYSITRDVNNKITAVTAATGTWEQRKVQVDDSSTMNFGSVAAGTNGVFQNSTESSDIFQTLITLRDTLEAGTTPPESLLQDVTDSMNAISGALVDNGITQRRFEELENYYEKLDIAEIEQLSKIEDTDRSKAITEMSMLETSLQASLQITSRINRLSIVNFM